MVEVKVGYISTDKKTGTQVVILEQAFGDPIHRLMIWIGESEAAAISTFLDERSAPRPMTHDLIKNIVDTLSTTVNAVHITKVEASTFYAKLSLKTNTQEISIDARPSAAIAVAIRCNSPIYVDEDVLENHGFLEKENEDG